MLNLSIVIPTYNAEDYIEKLADNLLEVNGVEIIFVDDGSTDNTLNLIDKIYKKKAINSELVKVISKKHSGVSKSRNEGIRESKGKYITFIDVDDKFDAEKLSFLVHQLTYWDKDIIYCQKDFENQSIVMTPQNRYCILQSLLLKQKITKFNQGIIQAAPWAKFFNREFLLRNNIFFPEDVVFGEDLLFNVAAATKAKLIQFSSVSFYEYRNNLNSVSKSLKFNIIKNSILFFEELENLVGRNSKIYKEKSVNSLIGDAKKACQSNKDDKYIKELIDVSLKRNMTLKNLSMKNIITYLMIKFKAIFLLKKLVNIRKRVRKYSNVEEYQQV